MPPEDDSLDQPYEPVSSVQTAPAVVPAGAPVPVAPPTITASAYPSPPPEPVEPKRRLLSKRFNRLALGLTLVVVGLIIVIGLGSLLLSGVGKQEDGGQRSANFSVGDLAVEDITAEGQLSVGQAAQLTINGQLNVRDSLVLEPGEAPGEPTAGQIYYDQATNQPYYYDGTQFISLAPTAFPQHVSSIGGVAGDIGVGNGLQVTNGQLSLAPGVIQESDSPGVQTLVSGSANLVVSHDGNGNYTLTDNSVVGSGTPGQIAMFTGASTLGDSILSQSGSTVNASGNLTVTGAVTVGGPISANTLQQTAVGQDITISAGADGIIFEAFGRTYTFEDAGPGAQTICTSFYTCTAPGGMAVLLQPGPVQVDSGSGSSIFINNTGGGNLIQLQGAGSDRFIVANNGNTSVSGTFTAGGTVTLSNLNSPGVVHTNGSGVLSTGDVVLGTETSGSYVQSIGALTGLSTTGNSGEGSTPTLSVLYGAAANTAVQGNTTITCASGSGNLTGGGNTVTLGAGGICNDISIVNSPTFSGDLTVQGANGISVGIAGSVAGIINLANGTNANLGTIQVAALAQGTVYTLPDPGLAAVDICLSTGNCAGLGGGITGSGTTGQLAKFNSSGSITDSTLSESGATVTASGNMVIQGAGSLTLGTASTNTGSVAFRNSSNGNTVTLQSGASGSSFSLTLPTNGGNNGECLQSQGGGVLVFTACTGGSAGGVTSLNGLTGVLTVANATGSGTTITIDDASTVQKGIAQFDGVNFQVSSGLVNTVQDIDVTAAPTFAGLTLTNALTVPNGGTGDDSFTTNGIIYGNGTGALQVTNSLANAVLVTDGSGVPNLGQTLPVAVQGNITATGVLTSGSISTGFGTILTGNTITGTTLNGTVGVNTGAGAGTLRIDALGNLVNIGTITSGLINGQTISSSANFTGTLAVQGSVFIGTPGSSTGTVVFANSSSTRAVILQGNNPSGTGNATISLPSIAGGTSDTVCLLTLSNCVGLNGAVSTSGGTQNYITKYSNPGATDITSSQLYDDGNFVGLNTTTNNGQLSVEAALGSEGLFVKGVASGGETVGVFRSGGGVGDLLQLQNSGSVNVVSVGYTGDTLFKVSTDSTTAFQIQNATGVAVLRVSTDVSNNIFLADQANLYFGNNNRILSSGTQLMVQNSNNGGALRLLANGTAGSIEAVANTYSFNDVTNAFTHLGISDIGAATFRNSTDSTTGFQVQNAAGAAMLTVDTTTGNVAVGGTFTAGDALIGTSAGLGAGVAVFAHNTLNNATDFALLQDSGGSTFLNAAAGQFIGFGNGGNLIGSWTDVQLEVTGSTSKATIALSGSGTGEEGIAFGSDTVLYRGGTSTLTTDDNLHINNVGNNSDAFLVQNSSGDEIFKVDASNVRIVAGGDLIANRQATGTTGTTEATPRTNVTTVTLTAAGSFADNDVIFIDNAGQDYYTRIVSGGGTTTLTVSPAVSYDASASVTKYVIQNVGAEDNDYTSQGNRFFQGYFLGGVVVGAGTTTLSDGNLSSTTAMNFQSPSYKFQNTSNSTTSFQIQNAAGTTVMGIDTTSSRIFSGVADGASAIGFKFDTPAYTTAGAKLLSVQNNGVEKFSIDKDGNVAAAGRFSSGNESITGLADGANATFTKAIPYDTIWKAYIKVYRSTDGANWRMYEATIHNHFYINGSGVGWTITPTGGTDLGPTTSVAQITAISMVNDTVSSTSDANLRITGTSGGTGGWGTQVNFVRLY